MENVDKKSTFSISTIIFTVMSFCLPLAGLVVWWLQKRTDQKKAKIFLIAALLGFCANYLVISLR
jgi:uncharacterized membrane protein YfhO